jgi:hypothetical protein
MWMSIDAGGGVDDDDKIDNKALSSTMLVGDFKT